MLLSGVAFLDSLIQKGGFSAKAIFNARGAIFFPVDRQHREQKLEGVSYEDNYAGNAMAAMLSPGRIEIRYHRDFADQDVCRVVSALLNQPDLQFMRGRQVTYQGRLLAVPG
jgi:hypothetical protein